MNFRVRRVTGASAMIASLKRTRTTLQDLLQRGFREQQIMGWRMAGCSCRWLSLSSMIISFFRYFGGCGFSARVERLLPALVLIWIHSGPIAECQNKSLIFIFNFTLSFCAKEIQPDGGLISN